MNRRVAVLLLGLMLAIVACQRGAMEVNVHYERIAGLTVGDRLMFDGQWIGKVEAVEYTAKAAYIVRLSVPRSNAKLLTEHARFHIVPDPDLAGRKAVEVRLTQDGGRSLAHGENVIGSESSQDLAQRLQQDIAAGLRFFEDVMESMERDIQEWTESREYAELKRSLDALTQALLRSGKTVRDKLKREWLPEIQRQLDQLRERLKQQGRERELKPLEDQIERIRRI